MAFTKQYFLVSNKNGNSSLYMYSHNIIIGTILKVLLSLLLLA